METELPASTWADVLEYLLFHEQIHCSVINKRFLFEICPLITTVFVARSSNLVGAAVRRRFSGVTNIDIWTMFQHVTFDEDDENDHYADAHVDDRIDLETSEHAIDFLCSFPKLQEAYIGYGYTYRRIHLRYLHNILAGDSTQLRVLHRFIRRACEAISDGRLRRQAIQNMDSFIPANSFGPCFFKELLHNERGANNGAIGTCCPTCMMVARHFCAQNVIRECWFACFGEYKAERIEFVLSNQAVSDAQATNLLCDELEETHVEALDADDINALLRHGANPQDPRIRNILIDKAQHELFKPEMMELFNEWRFDVSKKDFFKLSANGAILGYSTFSAAVATRHLVEKLSNYAHCDEMLGVFKALLGTGADSRNPEIRNILLRDYEYISGEDALVDFYVKEFDVTREEILTGVDSRKKARTE